MQQLFSTLRQAFDAPWWTPNEVAHAWNQQFRSAPGRFGYPINILAAISWCVCVFGPTGAVEIGNIAIAATWFFRLPFIWRSSVLVALQPASIACVLFLSWMTSSLLWTNNVEAGLHELSYCRWIGALLGIWPVLDNRRGLIGFLCVGGVMGVGSQVLEFFEISAWSHPPSPDPRARISGWWYQPTIGAAMLVAFCGLLMGPMLFGTGWRRMMGALGVGIGALGIVLTGSRGSVLALALLIFLSAMLGLMYPIVVRGMGVHERRVPTRGLVVMLLCALAAGAGAVALSPSLRERAMRAAHDIRAAGGRNDFDSDSGGRVLAASAAITMSRESPLLGSGVGGFHAGLKEQAARVAPGIAPFRVEALKTAHNTLLHAWATTGLIGAGLLTLVFATGLHGAFWLPVRAGKSESPHPLGTFSIGPCFALMGLACVGIFETVQVNLSTAALATTLIALSPAVAPRADALTRRS